jgi:acyl-CoA thioester hydrolase
MGVVHHANYYIWMEVARVELCVAMGFRYRDMEQQDGVLLAVIESGCRYLQPVRFDDEVLITTRLSNANARLVTFSYDMTVEGRHMASGETRHIFLNRQLKPTRLPARYHPLSGIAAKKCSD